MKKGFVEMDSGGRYQEVQLPPISPVEYSITLAEAITI
jgi:hypothetical protein